MLIESYHIIFVHQRKCAGSAIMKALSEVEEINYLLQDGLVDENWARYNEIVNTYRKFCIIRNPWDRFISGWIYLSRYKHLDIKTVLENLPRLCKDPVENHDYRHLTRCQSDLMFDNKDKCVMNRILRFENLESQFREMCVEWGLPITSNLEKVNVTEKPFNIDYRDYFRDAECCELFELQFERDIKLLDYRFDDRPGRETEF